MCNVRARAAADDDDFQAKPVPLTGGDAPTAPALVVAAPPPPPPVLAAPYCDYDSDAEGAPETAWPSTTDDDAEGAERVLAAGLSSLTRGWYEDVLEVRARYTCKLARTHACTYAHTHTHTHTHKHAHTRTRTHKHTKTSVALGHDAPPQAFGRDVAVVDGDSLLAYVLEEALRTAGAGGADAGWLSAQVLPRRIRYEHTIAYANAHGHARAGAGAAARVPRRLVSRAHARRRCEPSRVLLRAARGGLARRGGPRARGAHRPPAGVCARMAVCIRVCGAMRIRLRRACRYAFAYAVRCVSDYAARVDMHSRMRCDAYPTTPRVSICIRVCGRMHIRIRVTRTCSGPCPDAWTSWAGSHACRASGARASPRAAYEVPVWAAQLTYSYPHACRYMDVHTPTFVMVKTDWARELGVYCDRTLRVATLALAARLVGHTSDTRGCVELRGAGASGLVEFGQGRLHAFVLFPLALDAQRANMVRAFAVDSPLMGLVREELSASAAPAAAAAGGESPLAPFAPLPPHLALAAAAAVAAIREGGAAGAEMHAVAHLHILAQCLGRAVPLSSRAADRSLLPAGSPNAALEGPLDSPFFGALRGFVDAGSAALARCGAGGADLDDAMDVRFMRWLRVLIAARPAPSGSLAGLLGAWEHAPRVAADAAAVCAAVSRLVPGFAPSPLAAYVRAYAYAFPAWATRAT